MTAHVAQAIKAAMHDSPNWESMSSSQREGLDMIAQKLARILTGNHAADEHWEDIVGYTEMIRKELVVVPATVTTLRARVEGLNAIETAVRESRDPVR